MGRRHHHGGMWKIFPSFGRTTALPERETGAENGILRFLSRSRGSGRRRRHIGVLGSLESGINRPADVLEPRWPNRYRRESNPGLEVSLRIDMYPEYCMEDPGLARTADGRPPLLWRGKWCLRGRGPQKPNWPMSRASAAEPLPVGGPYLEILGPSVGTDGGHRPSGPS